MKDKKLIEGEEKMTEPNYKDLFVKTKIEGFTNSLYAFKENFENYKGYVLSTFSSAQEEYFDFLAEMRGYGIERDEIEKVIIRDYLSEKEKK